MEEARTEKEVMDMGDMEDMVERMDTKEKEKEKEKERDVGIVGEIIWLEIAQTLKKDKWFLVARRQVARRRLVASGKEEAQATVDRHEKANWKQVRYLLSLVYLLVK